MKSVVKWLVVVSGVYDLLLGAVLVLAARPVPATWLITMTIGAFLVFAGLILIWAAFDLPARASAVIWQGLVRLWAAGATFYGIAHHYLAPEAAASSALAAWIDLAFVLVYVVGLVGIWRLSLAGLVFGRSGPAAR